MRKNSDTLYQKSSTIPTNVLCHFKRRGLPCLFLAIARLACFNELAQMQQQMHSLIHLARLFTSCPYLSVQGLTTHGHLERQYSQLPGCAAGCLQFFVSRK